MCGIVSCLVFYSYLCLCGLVFAADQQPIKTDQQPTKTDQQPIKIPSQDQSVRSTSQYVITPLSRPSRDNLVELDLTDSPKRSEGNDYSIICSVIINTSAGSEAFYHTLESPVVTVAPQSLQLPTSKLVWLLLYDV